MVEEKTCINEVLRICEVCFDGGKQAKDIYIYIYNRNPNPNIERQSAKL